MRRTTSFLILASLAALGCRPAASTFSAAAPSTGNPSRPGQGSDAYPSKEEVLDYLDGKTIALSAAAAPMKGETQFVVKRDQIEAMQVDDSGTKVGDGPWTTAVTFLARTDQGVYAVKMTIQHRRVETKRTFSGFQVSEMAKQ